MTRFAKYLLLLFLVIPLYAKTQVKHADSAATKLELLVQKDTIVIEKQIADYTIAKNYAEILEKTNSQLSLWWNPYAVLIATLGILFAIMAIIAAFLIFRQSNEYKTLIKKSLGEHKTALDKLIAEQNLLLENDRNRWNTLLLEYKEKLRTAEEETRPEISEFINKLEEQIEFIDPRIRSFKHSGWQHKDIQERYVIDTNTIFNARITLNSNNQAFVIYLRIRCTDNKHRWLGFAGNIQTNPVKNETEYTIHKYYDSKSIKISENIISLFKQGFSEAKVGPFEVDCIRLRGSDVDMSDINFSFKIT
jgi:hypothetical protein